MKDGTDSPARTGDPQIHNLSPDLDAKGKFCKPALKERLSDQTVTNDLQTLYDRLPALQAKAMLAENLLTAIMGCLGDHERQELMFVLIDAAHDITREVNTELDSVNVTRIMGNVQ